MLQVNLGAINTGYGGGAFPQMPGGGPGGAPTPTGGFVPMQPYYPYMPAGGYYTPPPPTAPPIVQPPRQTMPQPLPLPQTPGTPPVPGGAPTCPDGSLMAPDGSCSQSLPVAGTNVVVGPSYDDSQGFLVGDYQVGSAAVPKWLLIGLGLGVVGGVVAYMIHSKRAKPAG